MVKCDMCDKPSSRDVGAVWDGSSQQFMVFCSERCKEVFQMRRYRRFEDTGLDDDVWHTHKWQKYVGFTETYEFCECGAKR